MNARLAWSVGRSAARGFENIDINYKIIQNNLKYG